MRRILTGAILLLTLGWVTALGPMARPQGGTTPEGLTAQDQEVLAQLAEKALKAKGLWRGKVVLTRVEVFPDRGQAQAPLKAVVIHYRYEGNAALLTRIDVERREVLGVAEEVDFPTSLHPEEVRRAEELARGHNDVKKFLAKQAAPGKVEVDAMVGITVDPKAFGFRHRVVRLFFREGRDYLLYAPNVDVDLTTETLLIRRNDKDHPK